ncbi:MULTISPECIES: hypothetical protein [Paenibacillus]|uniref:Uncharacterized protein n=2 Tax=Paenibacillus TaxID=44249 RepID=A0A0U2VMM9_9BACL|nr:MULTISPECIES: hypothetical protein [Paenibacillus]ALS20759.1 hypothetical protein IJ22_03700 [Paenibacillus naphthalenovorans]GCL70788.1 hypothetical protein PN4B1_06900 [Paenibacillus naphthalenovorans]SDI22958.1 hypothetical protein SAMN05421868_104148 [Paenibacillus naphthalenovorans]
MPQNPANPRNGPKKRNRPEPYEQITNGKGLPPMDNELQSIIEELASIQRRYSHIHTNFDRLEQKISHIEKKVWLLEHRTSSLALPAHLNQPVRQV